VKPAAKKHAEKTAGKKTKQPQTVRILLHEPDGEVFADFEIPKAFHAAMLRDAKAKGIGLRQWIENAVRDKINSEAAQDNNIALLFYSKSDGSSPAQVNLAPEQFAAIKRGAENCGFSLEQFLNLGLARILASLNDDGLTELEMTHIKVQGLLQLLADKIEHLARLDGTEFKGESAEHFSSAVGLLVRDAQDSLTKSFDVAFDAAHPQPTDVAKIIKGIEQKKFQTTGNVTPAMKGGAR
jgi:hypothetical protein